MDLAKFMGIKPQEVTRILDLHHTTKIDALAVQTSARPAHQAQAKRPPDSPQHLAQTQRICPATAIGEVDCVGSPGLLEK